MSQLFTPEMTDELACIGIAVSLTPCQNYAEVRTPDRTLFSGLTQDAVRYVTGALSSVPESLKEN